MAQDPGIQSLGRTRLNELIDDDGWSQSGIAGELSDRGAKVSQSAVSQWCRGLSRPEPPLRAALETVLGIPADAWLDDEERLLVEKVRTSLPTGSRRGRTPRGNLGDVAQMVPEGDSDGAAGDDGDRAEARAILEAARADDTTAHPELAAHPAQDTAAVA